MPATTAESVEPFIYVEPLDPPPRTPVVRPTPNASVLELVEEMLKRPATLELRMRDVPQLVTLVPRLLAIAVVGYTAFCFAAALTLSLSPTWPIGIPHSALPAGNWVALFVAYDVGILAAIGICLPSFYFYTLLAGVRITLVETVAHAVKGHAVAAVVLVGMLPVYVAVTLGLMVFRAPDVWVHTLDYLFLALPFQAGLAGAVSLYRGFSLLCDTMPAHFAQRRHCFLRRLLISWCGCSTVITPLVIYTIWVSLAGSLR